MYIIIDQNFNSRYLSQKFKRFFCQLYKVRRKFVFIALSSQFLAQLTIISKEKSPSCGEIDLQVFTLAP